MLPERITQLLSAYVDGELSARERRAVTRLLRKSPEARQLLHQLKKDSMILRRLPRKKTQLDLSGSVMGTLSLRNIQLPKIEESAPPDVFPGLPGRRRPVWMKAMLAGLFLLAVGVASYLLFTALFQTGSVQQKGLPTTGSEESPAPHAARPSADQPPIIPLIHEPEQGPGPSEQDARRDERAGLTRLPLPPFEMPRPRLMAIVTLRDLDQPPGSAHLLHELKRDPAVRLDLFCLTDTRKALERLQTLFKARNVMLRIDSFAQARLKGTQKTHFAMYTEDLTPEEVMALVQQLAVEDKKSQPPLFDKLTVNPLTPAEMARVLGGEPSLYQRPAQTGPLGVDLSQDISARTGSQVVQNLTGQGSGGAQAVLVPYGLPHPGFSQEVRNLVEYRKGWKAGTLQVLLVLWNN